MYGKGGREMPYLDSLFINFTVLYLVTKEETTSQTMQSNLIDFWRQLRSGNICEVAMTRIWCGSDKLLSYVFTCEELQDEINQLTISFSLGLIVTEEKLLASSMTSRSSRNLLILNILILSSVLQTDIVTKCTKNVFVVNDISICDWVLKSTMPPSSMRFGY